MVEADPKRALKGVHASAETTLVSGVLDNRTAARWLGIAAIVVAIVMAISILSFGLDALQVRRMIREDAKPGFYDAALKSLVLAVLFIPSLLYTGWRGFQFAKGASEKRDVDGPPIVIGG